MLKYILLMIVKSSFLIPTKLLYSIIELRFINEKNLLQSSKKINDVFKWDDKKIRYDVWDEFIKHYNLEHKECNFLEFGVYKGESLIYFLKRLKNKKNLFYGFDTFTGLPSKWKNSPKGFFSTDGKIPNISDKRLKFFKGLFQETFNKNVILKNQITIVHFDADLYSSTLFLLFKLNERLSEYYFIFDEFEGEELRAFLDFSKLYKIKYEIKFYSKFRGLVHVCAGKITKIN